MFDIWKALFPHIVLSAGSTMFPGFADRVQKTITELVPNNTTVNIIAPPKRKYSTWIGDTVLPSFADRVQKAITGFSPNNTKIHQTGSTPSGSVAPSWPPSPPSSPSGSPRRSATSPAPPSSTGSASRLELLLLYSSSRISCESFHLLANEQIKVQ